MLKAEILKKNYNGIEMIVYVTEEHFFCYITMAENRQGLWPSTWESQFWWIFKLHPYTSTIYQILAYKLRILNM